MLNEKKFRAIYDEYLSSGLTIRDYCANQQINEAKFYYWQNKLKGQLPPKRGFVPVAFGNGHSSLKPQVTGSLQHRDASFLNPTTASSPDGNLPIHQQENRKVGCTQETMESFVEYKGGNLNLNKSAGADFRQLGEDLRYNVKRNYNNVYKVGGEILKGNPSAITYDSGGVQHTVGINKISVMRTTKLFGNGYRYKNIIQVMNPLHSTYQRYQILYLILAL